MTISLDEFRRRAPQDRSADRLTQVRHLEQEAVRAQALTGSESWDWFLRYVEAQIKAAEGLSEHHKGKAAEMVLIDEAKARHHAVLCTAAQVRAQTLRDVLMMPKWLIEQGEHGKRLIEGIESDVA